MQSRNVTHLSRFLLIAALVAGFSLATTSNIAIPVLKNVNDKLTHLLAFFALSLLVDFSWPSTRFLAPKILSLLGYGLGIEIVQYFLSYRTFSLFDLGADALGLFLYRMTIPLLKTLSPFKVRWKVDIGS